MKKILTTATALLSLSLVQAQQNSGKVTYERIVQIKIQLNGMGDEIQNSLPKVKKDNFDLIFGNNQSIWKQAERELEDDNSFGDGIQIHMVGPGDDIVYFNFSKNIKVEQREVFDKKFVVEDSIRPLKWKMTTDTKLILNHNCIKAIAADTLKKKQMTVENSKMVMKEILDTTNIIAWIATDIPVAAGPEEYQGQLPGLILEMDMDDGKQVYKATSISEQADLNLIKEPQAKKRYTREEFRKEVNKMMDEMQRNNRGMIKMKG